MHLQQCLGLQGFGGGDGPQCGADSAPEHTGHDVDVHQTAGRLGAEPHQGHHLGALRRGHQLQNRATAGLTQVENGICRIVRAHAAEESRDIAVGHVFEQLAGLLRIEFLEYVGLELRVVADAIQDLAALLLGGLLEQIGDLGGLEGVHPSADTARQQGTTMPDHGFEGFPIPPSLARASLDKTEKPCGTTSIETGKNPPLSRFLQLDVIGVYQFGVVDIDEPVVEYVLVEQVLTVTALEAPEVNLVLAQLDSIRRHDRNHVRGNEDGAPAHVHDVSGDERIPVGPAEPDNHILQPANGLTGPRDNRSLQ
ncbi:Uncharacterised protein [Mycobacteroides abscessus subsp. abscessus]|nr:Uncharacterised protein [Mycobacteroides abscessus subsp. abscessus]